MNRYHLVIFLLVAICMYTLFNQSTLLADNENVQITTQEQAAKLASELANKRCLAAFGVSPFTPESYTAQLMGERWHWGKIEPPGIHGYSAEVEFDIAGSDEKIRVVLHTDKIIIPDLLDITINQMENEINDLEEIQRLEIKGSE